MAYENNDKRQESVYSSRVKAGKRRTYFFDVRATRANDYFLTITESRKRFDDDGYDRSKLFLYKEDFNKFIKGLVEAVDYVKTDLMPDFNFDAFNHDDSELGPNDTPTPSEIMAPNNELNIADTMVPAAVVADTIAMEEPEIVETMNAPIAVTESTNHQHVSLEEVDKW